MANVSESLIQEILDMKKSVTKTASKKATKLDVLSDTLLKMAEELEEKEEEGEESEKGEEGKEEEKGEESKSSEGEDGNAENIVEAALAELDKTKEARAGVTKVSKIDYTKLAQEILKVAVDGTGAYGLDKDMTASPKAEAGNIANGAQADAEKRISEPSGSDKEMGVVGPTDPMQGVAPQSAGGDETALTPGEIKSAMAKMSTEDAVMLFKLAQVGYDVTVDVLSDEIVEKQAMAKVVEKAERVKAAQAYNYLKSLGIDPLR